MAVTATAPPRPARRIPARVPKRISVPWVVAGLLATYALLIELIYARTAVLQRGDEGLLLTTVTYTVHGQIPITDFYEPYGIGLGIPGAVAHLLGFNSVLAIRITYNLFPPLVTLLATVFVWRRTDWKLAVLVGLVSLDSLTPRYSMGYAAVFGFLLVVDWLVRRTVSGSLQEVAARNPIALALAGALLTLSGWARVEYEIFGVIWAAVLVFALRGRARVVQAATAFVLACLPTIIVLATGGARHLEWIVRYLTSSSVDSFRVQRGHPIDWNFIPQRFSELFHGHLASIGLGQELGGYAVGFAVLIAAVCLYAIPRTRRRLLRDDPAYLTPFTVGVAAVTLYGLKGHFDVGYATTGAFLMWTAGALLVKRIPLVAAVIVGVLLGAPFLKDVSPVTWLNTWNSRPEPTNVGVAPGLKDIPVAPDVGGPSMAALVAEWRQLGLQGRSTLAVARRNDVFWSNDMIVGYLLDAPPAAWPLTYDPGIVNRDDAERETVQSLCHNRAPIVQLIGSYGYLNGVPVYVGSRRLDEFLAVDYGVRAVAGIYRILLPITSRCVLPQTLSDGKVASLRDHWIVQGEMPEAGALSVLLMDRERARGERVDPVNESVAALGGYRLAPDELPPDPLRQSLLTLGDLLPRPSLDIAVAVHWPSDLEALAAQTAWEMYRPVTKVAGEASSILALAVRHPNWPQAIANATGVVPPGKTVFRLLARAAGDPAFDQWRMNYYMATHQFIAALSAGLATIADYKRIDDPVNLFHFELVLSSLRGLPLDCAVLLRRSAAEQPGSPLRAGSGPLPTCPIRAITETVQ